DGAFHQALSDAYFDRLAQKESLQNELHLSMLYRPLAAGRSLVERSADLDRLRTAERQAVDRIHELAESVEAVIRDYSPRRLGTHERGNGVVFSELLELYGYLLNRVDEPVPVLSAPVPDYLPVSRHTFSSKTGDFVVTTPQGGHDYGAILNVKEFTEST